MNDAAQKGFVLVRIFAWQQGTVAEQKVEVSWDRRKNVS